MTPRRPESAGSRGSGARSTRSDPPSRGSRRSDRATARPDEALHADVGAITDRARADEDPSQIAVLGGDTPDIGEYPVSPRAHEGVDHDVLRRSLEWLVQNNEFALSGQAWRGHEPAEPRDEAQERGVAWALEDRRDVAMEPRGPQLNVSFVGWESELPPLPVLLPHGALDGVLDDSFHGTGFHGLGSVSHAGTNSGCSPSTTGRGADSGSGSPEARGIPRGILVTSGAASEPARGSVPVAVSGSHDSTSDGNGAPGRASGSEPARGGVPVADSGSHDSTCDGNGAPGRASNYGNSASSGGGATGGIVSHVPPSPVDNSRYRADGGVFSGTGIPMNTISAEPVILQDIPRVPDVVGGMDPMGRHFVALPQNLIQNGVRGEAQGVHVPGPAIVDHHGGVQDVASEPIPLFPPGVVVVAVPS